MRNTVWLNAASRGQILRIPWLFDSPTIESSLRVIYWWELHRIPYNISIGLSPQLTSSPLFMRGVHSLSLAKMLLSPCYCCLQAPHSLSGLISVTQPDGFWSCLRGGTARLSLRCLECDYCNWDFCFLQS